MCYIYIYIYMPSMWGAECESKSGDYYAGLRPKGGGIAITFYETFL